MPPTLDTASRSASEENERHLFGWKVDLGFAADPHPATFNGQRSRHA